MCPAAPVSQCSPEVAQAALSGAGWAVGSRMLLPRGRTDNSGISGLKFLMGPFGPTPRLVGRPSSEALSEGSDAFESFFFF